MFSLLARRMVRSPLIYLLIAALAVIMLLSGREFLIGASGGAPHKYDIYNRKPRPRPGQPQLY